MPQPTIDPLDQTVSRDTFLGSQKNAPELDRSAVHLTGAPKVGRYLILDRLGAGAMGVVFAAYDAKLDRKVALKLLHSVRREDSRRRLRMEREAQAMAKLSHPNVVTVYEVDEFDSQLFVAMEFINGQNLRDWLQSQAQPPHWRVLLDMFIQAGNGLEAAHANGVVHRDFKPDNVFVGDDGRVCVGDFGLARLDSRTDAHATDPEIPLDQVRALARELTMTGATVGTPAYMAPEQYLGQPVDARTDQFAFCVALWEALYEQRPYAGKTLAELMMHVTEGVRVEPPKTNVPTWLRAVLLRGLEVDPARRWPNMQALLAELKRDHWATFRKWSLFGLALATVTLMGFGLQQIFEEQAATAAERARAVAAEGERDRDAERHLHERERLTFEALIESGRFYLQQGQPLRAAPRLAEAYRIAPHDLVAGSLVRQAVRPLDQRREFQSVHTQPITHIEVSADGNRMTTMSAHLAVLWSLPEGALLAKVEVEPRAVRFTSDSQKWQVSSQDGVQIYDARDGRELKSLTIKRPLLADNIAVGDVDMTGLEIRDLKNEQAPTFVDHRWLHGRFTYLSEDGALIVRTVGERLNETSRFPSTAPANVMLYQRDKGYAGTKLTEGNMFSSGKLSPSASLLVISVGSEVQLWQTRERQKLLTVDSGEEFSYFPWNAMHSVFSADEQRVALHLSGGIAVYDTTSTKLLHRINLETTDPNQPMAFAPGGQTLAVIKQDGRLHGYGIDNPGEHWSIDGHLVGATALAWTEAGILTGGSAGLFLWQPPKAELRPGKYIAEDIPNKQYATIRDDEVTFWKGDKSFSVVTPNLVKTVRFAPSGTYAVISHEHGATLVKGLIGEPETKYFPEACDVDFDTERAVALLQTSEGMRLIDLQSGDESSVLGDKIGVCDSRETWSLAAGGRVAIHRGRSEISFYDLETGTKQSFPKFELSMYARDDQKMTIVSRDQIFVWNHRLGELTGPQILPASASSVVLRSELYTMLQSKSGLVGFVQMASGHVVEFDDPLPVSKAKLKPDNSQIATWGGGHLMLLDTESGAVELDITAPDFHEKAELWWLDLHGTPALAVASKTGLQIYNAETGRLEHRLITNSGARQVHAFSDGRRLTTIHQNGLVHVWSLRDDSVLFTFTTDKLNRNILNFDANHNILEFSGPQGIYRWDIAPETRSPREIQALIESAGPWVLRDGRVVRREVDRADQTQ